MALATKISKRKKCELHQFDRRLCQYICEAICDHLPRDLKVEDLPALQDAAKADSPPDPNGRCMCQNISPPERGFARHFAHRVPVVLQEFIVRRGEPSQLLTEDDFRDLEHALGDDFRMYRPLSRQWNYRLWIEDAHRRCLTELHAVSEPDGKKFADHSDRAIRRLRTRGVGLGEGVSIVGEWIILIRDLLATVGREDLRPMPEGKYLTVTDSANLPAPVTAMLDRLRAYFKKTPKLKKSSKRAVRKAVTGNQRIVFLALDILSKTGEYQGSSRRGPPRVSTAASVDKAQEDAK